MLWRFLAAWLLVGIAGLLPAWSAFEASLREMIRANNGYSTCPHGDRRRRWWRFKVWAGAIGFAIICAALGGPLVWMAMAVKAQGSPKR